MTSLERAFEEIDRYVERRISEVNMPGMALAVTDRERLLRVATFGYADLAAGTPVQPGSMFEIGSIGKSFTNVALMQLAMKGSWTCRRRCRATCRGSKCSPITGPSPLIT